MKKLILLTITIISTFLSLLPAQELEDFAMVSIYENRGETYVYESNTSKTTFKDIHVSFAMLKSTDEAISIQNIKSHAKAFKPVPKTETFQDDNVTYWLKVDLGTSFPSGRFVYAYGDAGFSDNTILPSQQLEKFVLAGRQNMKFSYTQGVDPQIYYFKLIPKHYRIPVRLVYVFTSTTFYSYMSKYSHIQLILGLLLGLIVMAAIYNASMYYYNRDKAFLYYALMQLFMSLILYAGSGAFTWDEESLFSRNIIYRNFIALMASFFATLFVIYFLELKIHMPKLYRLTKIVLAFVSLDILINFFYKSLIIEYYILPFLMLMLIYAGYKRMRQGYKPARFYLLGWVVLTLAVSLDAFQIDYKGLPIDPLYIGATVEAILFSLALSYKMRLVHKEKEEQKELLVHQSKLASMGEMIGNIAHQWRQPLTHLGYTLMNISEAQKHGELNDVTLNNKIDEANTQLEFMSQTIDDFKDFYAPNKAQENFSLKTATEETLGIMANTLKLSDIEVELVVTSDIQVHNYKNEYKQVLLNLLANAKDALVESDTKAPKIRIVIDNNTVKVEDNAGGIKGDVLPRIFEPYFTTKEGNTGVGLYMSKMIVEKNMGGELSVNILDDKTIFNISF